MSEYLSKKAVLEWLKEQQKQQEEKRDRLEIDHPYWEYHEGASDYLSLSVEKIQSGAFDADENEIQRLREALEKARQYIVNGYELGYIDDREGYTETLVREIDKALSGAREGESE